MRYTEYAINDNDEVVVVPDEIVETLYLNRVIERDFAEKAKIVVDKVVDIADINNPSSADSEVEIDDLLDDEVDAIEEAEGGIGSPIKYLVKGCVTDGFIEIGFAAVIGEGREVKVFTFEDQVDSFDLRDKAALIVEKKLLNYIDL